MAFSARSRRPPRQREGVRHGDHSWGGSVTRDDYATVAYNVRTGARLWVRRYNGPARPRAQGGDSATALAARGGRVFVTGGSTGTTSGDDFATIAYNG